MAEHTATLTKRRDDIWGTSKVKFYTIDITSAGADGYTLSASVLGFRRIREVLVFAGKENGGYVLDFIPTTLSLDDCGDGKLRVYEAGADGAVLDEVTSGDLGEFRFAVLGY